MDESKQRIAILEASGWTPPEHERTLARAKDIRLDTVGGIPISVSNKWWLSADGNYFGMIDDPDWNRPVVGTDFLHDLDAMHVAVQCTEIRARGVFLFTANLVAVVKRDTLATESTVTADSFTDEEWLACAIFANAKQWAEAFLITVGRWEE